MNIAIIGTGKMGSALAQGILENGVAQELIGIEKMEECGQRFLEIFSDTPHKPTLTTSIPQGVTKSDVVIIAVKPSQAKEVLEEMREASQDKLIISIIAGLPLEKLEKALSPSTRVVRTMPNTPSLVSLGATAYVLGKKTLKNDEVLVQKIFSSVGISLCVKEEAMDAVTALSGSGPAYVYHFLSALISGGVELGLEAETAQALALQTVFGAVEMLKKSNRPPLQLANDVKSPGGTTVAACNVLEEKDWEEILKKAMRAAASRSQELGRS